MLLGYPTGDPRQTGARELRQPVSSPFDAYVHYFGGYAQDDWRLSPKTTINLGVRLEHETGLARGEQRLHGGVRSRPEPGRRARQRRQSSSPGSRSAAGSSTPASTAPTIPGRPAGDEVLAAPGLRALLQPEDGAARRLRHLLGAVELPGGRHGQLRQHRLQPAHLHQPGPVPPDRPRWATRSRTACCSRWATSSARWPASAARSSSSIRTSGRPGCSSTRSTSTASCRATWPSASSTPARRAVTSASADRTTASSTSTRCHPQYLALGPALLDQVPNPFFGLPNVVINGASFPQGKSTTQPDDSASRAAAALPAVQRHPDAAEHARREPVPRGDLQVREADEQRLGRAHQLHLQPPGGQPVRRGQLLRRLARLRQRGAAPRWRTSTSRRTTTAWMRSTASGCSTCRTSWCSRRSPSCRSAKARGG